MEKEFTLEDLKRFFEERKLLNVSIINNEAGLSNGHLGKILKGERPLSEHSLEKLLPVLELYGFRFRKGS
mgnify:CR=1 FL=1